MASSSRSMNRLRLARPVSPSCDAWKAICSAISQRSMASPTMSASWSSLCSSSLPKYGMEGLILTASAWVAPLWVCTVIRRWPFPGDLSASHASDPSSSVQTG